MVFKPIGDISEKELFDYLNSIFKIEGDYIMDFKKNIKNILINRNLCIRIDSGTNFGFAHECYYKHCGYEITYINLKLGEI